MPASLAPVDDGFCHEAFLYAGENEFVAGASSFLRDAVRAAEPVLAVVSSPKIDLLRRELEQDAGKVEFADMLEVGQNPARIIPAWADFVRRHPGRRLHGLGEPIWSERSPDELVECQLHESLLNVAFAEATGFTLMCPYDIDALGSDVVDTAFRNHPFIRRQGWSPMTSVDYLGTDRLVDAFSDPLPEPPSSAAELLFQPGSLAELRSLVWREAVNAGLGNDRADDAVTAVNEVASNTVRHAGGRGVLRIWPTGDSLVFEVRDDGHIDDPLVGRNRPDLDTPGGRGLWMVNRLCDLVQVRSLAAGTSVRMHLRRPPG
jgi:anti-sigma regulatory factor (Ser/Thr protein kinase)